MSRWRGPTTLFLGGLVSLHQFRHTCASDLLESGVSLYMANWHSSGDWQFKQPVAMAFPKVILKTGWLRCWGARFLPGRVAR